MRPVYATLDPNSMLFWIAVGVGTAVAIAIGRWLWMCTKRTSVRARNYVGQLSRDWLRENIVDVAKKAEERADIAAQQAEAAANHAEELKAAVGAPNGHGDLITIVTQILTRQEEQTEQNARDQERLATIERTVTQHMAHDERMVELAAKALTSGQSELLKQMTTQHQSNVERLEAIEAKLT